MEEGEGGGQQGLVALLARLVPAYLHPCVGHPWGHRCLGWRGEGNLRAGEGGDDEVVVGVDEGVLQAAGYCHQGLGEGGEAAVQEHVQLGVGGSCTQSPCMYRGVLG